MKWRLVEHSKIEQKYQIFIMVIRIPTIRKPDKFVQYSDAIRIRDHSKTGLVRYSVIHCTQNFLCYNWKNTASETLNNLFESGSHKQAVIWLTYVQKLSTNMQVVYAKITGALKSAQYALVYYPGPSRDGGCVFSALL
jgi:hypothetical protein